jgi:hypothetical protein
VFLRRMIVSRAQTERGWNRGKGRASRQHVLGDCITATNQFRREPSQEPDCHTYEARAQLRRHLAQPVSYSNRRKQCAIVSHGQQPSYSPGNSTCASVRLSGWRSLSGIAGGGRFTPKPRRPPAFNASA